MITRKKRTPNQNQENNPDLTYHSTLKNYPNGLSRSNRHFRPTNLFVRFDLSKHDDFVTEYDGDDDDYDDGGDDEADNQKVNPLVHLVERRMHYDYVDDVANHDAGMVDVAVVVDGDDTDYNALNDFDPWYDRSWSYDLNVDCFRCSYKEIRMLRSNKNRFHLDC